MRLKRECVIVTTGFALVVGYLTFSEIQYARSIDPGGIVTAEDYFEKFGEPRFVRAVRHEGEGFYEFNGHLPARHLMAHPSSPPAYVFDQEGNFVTWCSDPGDKPAYRREYQLEGTNLVEIQEVKLRFGL